MLYFLAGIFTLAAIFGVWVITFYFRKKRTNKKIVFIHGFFGGAGLMSFIVYISLPKANQDSLTPLLILLVAAFLGAVIFSYDIMQKRAPKWIWILHPIIALIGVGFLYYVIFR
ncbi:hypothetical protein BH10BAC5_BH10BAC5_16520 [soil metagenome]